MPSTSAPILQEDEPKPACIFCHDDAHWSLVCPTVTVQWLPCEDTACASRHVVRRCGPTFAGYHAVEAQS